jgi:hypothetical protein
MAGKKQSNKLKKTKQKAIDKPFGHRAILNDNKQVNKK